MKAVKIILIFILSIVVFLYLFINVDFSFYIQSEPSLPIIKSSSYEEERIDIYQKDDKLLLYLYHDNSEISIKEFESTYQVTSDDLIIEWDSGYKESTTNKRYPTITLKVYLLQNEDDSNLILEHSYTDLTISE